MSMLGKHLHKSLKAMQIKEIYKSIQKKQLIKQKNVLYVQLKNPGI
jgi:hypothetical protein